MKITQPYWRQIIEEEQEKPYFSALLEEIAEQRAHGEVIFPQSDDVFNAFSSVDLPNVKVVIIGQDPYHGTGSNGESQAHGLAFSVRNGIKTPPSLVNIYKELAEDIPNFSIPINGNLTKWADQGVLLLNTVFTVKQGIAHSHAKLGWEMFSERIISQLSEKNSGCVFMLWGAHAQKKGKNIDTNKHLVLSGPHPSPLSAYRGFFGCKHFSQTNAWLKANNHSEIDWQV